MWFFFFLKLSSWFSPPQISTTEAKIIAINVYFIYMCVFLKWKFIEEIQQEQKEFKPWTPPSFFFLLLLLLLLFSIQTGKRENKEIDCMSTMNSP
jgi:hypothetical protein